MNKFYRVRITRFGSPAFVITNNFKENDYFYREVICVFPGGREATHDLFLDDGESFEGVPVALLEDFALKEGVRVSKIIFDEYIQKKYLGKEPLLHPDGYRFDLIEVGDFVRLLNLMAGARGFELLLEIREKTRCCELRATLDPVLKNKY